MTKRFTLIPGQLNLNEIREALIGGKNCVLDDSARSPIEASVAVIENVLNKKQVVYGINTGFGSLANELISSENLYLLQKNLLRSHACGVGELLEDDVVSLILLLKINGLAQGYSGVRMKLIEHLIQLYNQKIYPCIPAKGSVGASGDLAPLAHLALPLIGEGEVRCNGEILSAHEGLKLAQLPPLELAPKEGLALINGLQVSCALALYAFFQSEKLFEAGILAGALTVDAACGSDTPFDRRIHEARGHESQCVVAQMYTALLEGSEIRASHRECKRVQDPYSLRCQPQIMGAVHHQMQFVGQTLQVEANAISDNPLIFSAQGDILSGGNFHGEIIAMAADNLALAIAEIGANAERRIALLIDKNFSGLPAYLVEEGGLNSGFMIAHVTAAASCSENKALAHPHSVDSIPTSANQEDHVSMATSAAYRLQTMIDNTATILAIECIVAAQGLEFRKPLKTSVRLQAVYDKIRGLVPPLKNDRYLAPDIAIIKQEILNGGFVMSGF